MQVNKPCITKKQIWLNQRHAVKVPQSHEVDYDIFPFFQKTASKDAYMRFVIKKIHMQSCRSMVQENFSEWSKEKFSAQ